MEDFAKRFERPDAHVGSFQTFSLAPQKGSRVTPTARRGRHLSRRIASTDYTPIQSHAHVSFLKEATAIAGVERCPFCARPLANEDRNYIQNHLQKEHGVPRPQFMGDDWETPLQSSGTLTHEEYTRLGAGNAAAHDRMVGRAASRAPGYFADLTRLSDKKIFEDGGFATPNPYAPVHSPAYH